MLNEIWEHDRIFTNYLLPQQKLVSKQRRGAKVTKKHDQTTTPHQRAIAHPATRKRPTITMNAAFKRIKLAALQRHVLALTGRGATAIRANQYSNAHLRYVQYSVPYTAMGTKVMVREDRTNMAVVITGRDGDGVTRQLACHQVGNPGDIVTEEAHFSTQHCYWAPAPPDRSEFESRSGVSGHRHR